MNFGLLRWVGSAERRKEVLARIQEAAGTWESSEIEVIEEPQPSWTGWQSSLNELAEIISQYTLQTSVYAPTAYELGATEEAFLRNVGKFRGAGAKIFLSCSKLTNFRELTLGGDEALWLADSMSQLSPRRIQAHDDARQLESGNRRALRISESQRKGIETALRKDEESLRAIAKTFGVTLRTVQRVRDQLKTVASAEHVKNRGEPPGSVLTRIRLKLSDTEQETAELRQ